MQSIGAAPHDDAHCLRRAKRAIVSILRLCEDDDFVSFFPRPVGGLPRARMLWTQSGSRIPGRRKIPGSIGRLPSRRSLRRRAPRDRGRWGDSPDHRRQVGRGLSKCTRPIVDGDFRSRLCSSAEPFQCVARVSARERRLGCGESPRNVLGIGRHCVRNRPPPRAFQRHFLKGSPSSACTASTESRRAPAKWYGRGDGHRRQRRATGSA